VKKRTAAGLIMAEKRGKGVGEKKSKIKRVSSKTFQTTSKEGSRKKGDRKRVNGECA